MINDPEFRASSPSRIRLGPVLVGSTASRLRKVKYEVGSSLGYHAHRARPVVGLEYEIPF